MDQLETQPWARAPTHIPGHAEEAQLQIDQRSIGRLKLEDIGDDSFDQPSKIAIHP